MYDVPCRDTVLSILIYYDVHGHLSYLFNTFKKLPKFDKKNEKQVATILSHHALQMGVELQK